MTLEWINLDDSWPPPGKQVLFGLGMDMGQVITVGHVSVSTGKIVCVGCPSPLWWLPIPPVPYQVAGGRA